MSKLRTFSLYLAKLGEDSFLKFLTESAQVKVAASEATVLAGTAIGERSEAYIFPNPPQTPKWLGEIQSAFSAVPAIRNSSSAAVVFFEQDSRIFAVTFAHGWLYLDESKFVADFGLKVAVNAINDSSLKMVEHNHLGEAMKGVSQSAFKRDIQSFGIDEALEIVRRVAGQSIDTSFASSLSGATALKITQESSLSDFGTVASKALASYSSKAYQKTGFAIIDKVKPITDRVMLASLNQKAVDVLKAKGDHFELAMPGWSEDDIVYFGFAGAGLRGRFPDLLVKDYFEALGDTKLATLTLDMISQNHSVIAEFNNDAVPNRKWSIKKSLVGSIASGGSLFAINEGEWFQLDALFKNDVDRNFTSLVKNWSSPPEVLIVKVSQNSKKIGLEPELDYNIRCAKKYGQVCLDQKIITVPTVPYGKFEACDLLDIQGKRLIHVKKSSRQSSVLSHFFKQGSNSARILRTYPEALDSLLEKVEAQTSRAIADDLKVKLGTTLDGWTIEYHIIDAPRSNGDYAIPFFSRITLREETRQLKGMGFDVVVRFIPMPKLKKAP